MTNTPERHHRQSLRLKGYDYALAGAYFVTVVAQNRACLFGTVENGTMMLSAAGEMLLSIWQALPTRYANVVLDAYVVMPNHFHAIIVFPAPLMGVNSHDPNTVVGASLVDAHLDDPNTVVGASLVDARLDDANTAVGASLVDARLDDANTAVGASLVDAHLDDANTAVGASLVDARLGDPNTVVGASLVDARLGDPNTAEERVPTRGTPTAGITLGEVVGAWKSLTTVAYIANVKTEAWKPFAGRLWQRNYYEHIVRDNEELARIRHYIVTNPQHWAQDAENPQQVSQ